MYGMINKAVEGLVRQRFGDAMWHKIRSGANLPDEPFLSMEQYPDETTYALVSTAAKELGANSEDILKEFGRYWMTYTAELGYGELLRSSGRNLPEFLKNLDALHTRVQMSMNHLRPPSFAVTDETADSIVLHYHTERPSLAPLVVGILEALGERFEVEIDIRHERTAAPRPHDVFHLRWRARGAA
ncbi:MAG: heme NO-binding protein [Planctomycetes bacterium]|nr:heme NO-binding protein [Planctomycetota bacterium]